MRPTKAFALVELDRQISRYVENRRRQNGMNRSPAQVAGDPSKRIPTLCLVIVRTAGTHRGTRYPVGTSIFDVDTSKIDAHHRTMARGSIKPPPGFGRAPDPDWQPSAEHDPVTVLSTYAAHRVAAEVRRAWARVYPTESFSGQALAGKLGESVRPVQKRLAGEQPLTLADVLALAALLGEEIFEALPRRDADLFPAAYGRLLNHWKPGTGLLPTFVEPGGGVIDWAAVARALAAYDVDEHQAQRQHLLTADTYCYQFATVLEAGGVPANHLEYEDVSIDHSRVMTLSTSSRLIVVVADLRVLRSRRDAAATLMRIIYETVTYGMDERILIVIAGQATNSQIEVHMPAALHTADEPFVLPFQQAVKAGLDSDGAPQLLPDIELTALGNAVGAVHQRIVVLRIGK